MNIFSNRTSSEAATVDRHQHWIGRAAVGLSGGLLSVFLAGCVVGPDYKPPRLQLGHSYPDQAMLSVVKSANRPPPLDAWWVGFHDPELIRIIHRVLIQNLSLQAAEARVLQARAVARQAGALELPQGSADGEIARQRQSLDSPLGKVASAFPAYERDQTLENVDLGASWELDLAGGLKRRAEAGTDEAQAAAALRDGVRISVAAEAADAYFQVRGDQARIAIARSQIKTDVDLLGLVRTRMTYGVATKRELAQAQALLSQARETLPPLQTSLQLQSNRLDVLMGSQPGTYTSELVKEHGHYVVPAIDTGEGPQQLLRRRPDVIAAERRLAASNADIGAAIAEYYPRVSLSGLLGFESLGTSSMFTSSSFQPAAMAGLHWRLFDFGRVDAEVAQARGAKAEALANFRQSMLRATEDVENAITTLVQLRLQSAEIRTEINADEQARVSAQDEYQAGSVDLIDVLVEDRQLLQARDALARVNANEARAAVATFRALGGGWKPAVRDHDPLDASHVT